MVLGAMTLIFEYRWPESHYSSWCLWHHLVRNLLKTARSRVVS